LSNVTVILYGAVLLLLIILSAFFSCAETGLMAINRYRLRHKARLKKRSAMTILRLLKRPDRLLGMILIGNTVANIFASALATLLAIHLFGDHSVVLVTVILTFVVLVFCEVAPKTVAALYPERIAGVVAWPITYLLKIFYPVVWFLNTVANGLLRLLGFHVTNAMIEPLSREELRSVVYEATGKVPHQYQSMLLGILDLNKVAVDDVMVPRHEIVGIDLDQPWEQVLRDMTASQHEWLPIYRENINQIVGVLHIRELMRVVLSAPLDEKLLLKMVHEPYFIPEGTFLNMQLTNFQKQQKRMALVVDEYGEILGLLTLKDILEEIVGEFTGRVSEANKLVNPQSDGSYLVDGAVTVRELNRVTHWHFPTDGPRTVNGLVVEQLESIPHRGTGILIAEHPVEILEVQENRVKTARVFPRLVRRDTELT